MINNEGSHFDFSDLLVTTDTKNKKCDKQFCGGCDLCGKKENYDTREIIPFVKPGCAVTLERRISNSDRAVGAALSDHLAKMATNHAVSVHFTGTAGQSFGAFLHRDVSFVLDGEANDYVGKSLSGGSIAIKGNVGNVIAYGATSGEIFIAGTAGERFAVRNSGATLVVEGVGDHGCEYMTGGTVAVLGLTGVNFGAGMTGGVAYVLDEPGDLDLNCNLDSLDLFPVEEGSQEEADLLALLERHKAKTGSAKVDHLLASWSQFVRDSPKSSPTARFESATLMASPISDVETTAGLFLWAMSRVRSPAARTSATARSTASASAESPREWRSIIAAERIVAMGFAIPCRRCPVRCRVSARTARHVHPRATPTATCRRSP